MCPHPTTAFRATAVAMATVTAILCAASAASAQSNSSLEPARIVAVTEIAHDLVSPWGLGFLPDGSALVSSRDTGDIRRIDPATGLHRSVGIVADVVTGNDAGLLGFLRRRTSMAVMQRSG